MEKVEEELEQLVELALDVIPSVREIRVFGSYESGNWNPEKSDVDVLVETSDELYSAFMSKHCKSQREEIRNEFIRKMDQADLHYRFEVHWFTADDVRRLSMRNQGRGSLGLNMKSGRLIYLDCQPIQRNYLGDKNLRKNLIIQ